MFSNIENLDITKNKVLTMTEAMVLYGLDHKVISEDKDIVIKLTREEAKDASKYLCVKHICKRLGITFIIE